VRAVCRVESLAFHLEVRLNVDFLAVFAASPRCVCTNSKYGVRIGANQSGVTGGEPTSAKLSAFVCVEENSDRGSENARAAGTRLRSAPGNVLPYRVSICGQQRQTAFLEVSGEAQPFVKMLADYFIRIAQLQQTTSNVVHALLVGRRAILLALVTRKPV
jgi:hypothetical protein